MRISIEVDLAPAEFPLASELLRTLNLFTEHVKIKGKPAAGAAGAAQPAPAAANGPVPVAAPVAVPVAAPPQAAPAAPAAPAGPPLPTSPQEARQLFASLIGRLGGPHGAQQMDAVSAELGRVLTQPQPPLSTAQLVEEFVEAFAGVAFDPNNIRNEQGSAPFMFLLPRLPEVVKGTNSIKAKVIAKVLGHLNQKRPLATAAKREEFYLQAEAFAVLAELDFVAIDGAVQTIEKLLKVAEKRPAAMTTLGKTVERCRAKLAGATPAHLGSLFKVLDGIMEETFRYDLEYIYDTMGRPRPAWLQPGAPKPVVAQQPPAAAAAAAGVPVAVPVAAPVAAAPAAAPAGPTQLPVAPPNLSVRLTGSFTSPGSSPDASIFALAWDPLGQVLATGGQDCPILVWGADGRVVHSIPTADMYVCGIDLDLQSRLMLVCGLGQAPGHAKARVALFDARPGQGYAHRGDVVRDEVQMVSAVRALPGTTHFVVGENVAAPGGPAEATLEQIALYDVHAVVGGGGRGAAPLSCFVEHTDMVTCIAPLGLGAGAPGVFLSGSRDKTVKIWDSRSPPKSVATLGVAAGDIAATTHSEMVTCLDVVGQTVISGSLDNTLALWDLRTTDQSGTFKPITVAGASSVYIDASGQQVEWRNGGVVKATMAGAPYDKLAAVATVQGLFTVDFSPPAPLIRPVPSAVGHDGVPKQYGDLRWSLNSRGQLYAAPGVGVAIDVLECVA